MCLTNNSIYYLYDFFVEIFVLIVKEVAGPVGMTPSRWVTGFLTRRTGKFLKTLVYSPSKLASSKKFF